MQRVQRRVARERGGDRLGSLRADVVVVEGERVQRRVDLECGGERFHVLLGSGFGNRDEQPVGQRIMAGEQPCERYAREGILLRQLAHDAAGIAVEQQGEFIEERDVEISLSPGFRWGTTLLPGQSITIEDLYTQTSMSYPNVYRTEMTGKQLKDILEDVCDNLFNVDPFYQQGGDMVRVGGMNYSCSPKNDMGRRIGDMTLTRTGSALDPSRSYRVGGWASINENVEGPAIYDLMESYINRKSVIDLPEQQAVRVIGM